MTVMFASFTEVTCTACGCVFGLLKGHDKELRESRATFYCPNGHGRAYRDSVVDKLTKQLAAERASLDQVRADRDAMVQKLNAANGRLAKLRNRVGNGVCICCNRTFANLARHMAAKHPGVAEDSCGGKHRASLRKPTGGAP